MNDSLRLHVEKITKLPTLPAIAQEILALADDDLLSINKLVKIIENDPAISAKILSVANSAYFGVLTQVDTLHSAIMRIGFNSVKNIAIGISVLTVLGDRKRDRAIDYQRIFNHSVAVGFIAKLLSRRFKLADPDQILINGLLHDIGLLIMSKYFPNTYLKVLDTFDNEKTLPYAEKEVFDFTHADIGRWMAEKWNLPDTVLDTVLYHHTPSLSQNNLKHVAIVHIADYIATLHIMRATARDYTSIFDPSCLNMLGMSEDDLNDAVTETKDGSLFTGLFTP
jgi:putative nucleotidyltransferase with HDIG domain